MLKNMKKKEKPPIMLHFFSYLDKMVVPWSLLMFPGHLERLFIDKLSFNGPIDWGRNYPISKKEKERRLL